MKEHQENMKNQTKEWPARPKMIVKQHNNSSV